MRNGAVRIDKMAFGGAGFGRVSGKACFVPFTAPQDMARVRVIKEKRSYLEGELIDLVESSPLRVTPPCPVFGRCGGCSWQHLEYSAQMAAKQEIFTELLWRSGRVPAERILPIIAAPAPYGYRSRVQVKLHGAAGRLQMGFYRTGSHYVVDMPGKCAIAQAAINHVLAELRPIVASCPESDSIPQVDVAVGDDDTAIVIFHYIGSHIQGFHAYLLETRHLMPSAGGIFIQSGRKSTIEKVAGVELLSYGLPVELLRGGGSPITLSFSRGGFSQVNYRQNLALIATVCDWAKLRPSDRLLDLFCGNGNFSIPLAGCVSEVVGVEDYAPSIADAVRNAEANGVENVVFTCCDATTGVRRMAAGGEAFDIVLLDPPRTGAAELVAHIPQLQPRAIVYVSCDPATLARDLGILRKSGYEVVASRPVDMFPQTYHIESVTLLEPLPRQAIS